MTPFFIAAWHDHNACAGALISRLKALLASPSSSWTIASEDVDHLVAVRNGGRFSIGGNPRFPTIIIGDVFSRDPNGCKAAAPPDPGAQFNTFCARLVAQRWGAYIAVAPGAGGRLQIFRDPVGMRDCATWTSAGIRFLASDPVPWLYLTAPDTLAIDWQKAATVLARPSAVFEPSLFAGIETVPPGTLVEFDGSDAKASRLWHPRQFCEREQDQPTEATQLRIAITRCVGAWMERYPNSLIELSGGFDSAVVAGAGGGRHPRCGINFFTADLSGDERRYARAVAGQIGMPLHELFMPVASLSESDLDGMPVGIRPGLGSATLFHDRRLTEVAARIGTDTLLTGHGGDAVFFQHPTPMIAAEPDFPRFSMGAHIMLAQWCRTSLWTTARHAFGPRVRRDRPRPDEAMCQLPLSAHASAIPLDWAGELSGLSPAKRLQVEAIAGERAAFGPSWRSQAMTVVHPLLSQPLIEHVLAIDIFRLTEGRRDRALTRNAMACALPAALINRDGKGALTHFFGRSLAASASFLRSYLLEGELAAHGLFDRVRLEAMLDRDFLMQFDCYGKILSALIMERWAREWRDRLAAIAQLAPRAASATN